MKHQHRFEISGIHYEIVHFTPTKSLRLMVTMGKILGQPLASLFSAEGDVTLETVLPAIVGSLTEKLDEAIVVTTIKELMDGTKAKNENGEWVEVTFDHHFMGRIGHLFKCLKEVIKFQYSDFLEGTGASGLVRQLSPKAVG